MTRILHLSDLHFGASHHFKGGVTGRRMVDAIVRVIGAESRVDALLVTGDIFSEDQPRDSLDAVDALREVRECLRLTPDRLWLVPGNHDLLWSEPDRRTRCYDDLVAAIGAPDLQVQSLPCLRVLEVDHARTVGILLLNSCVVEGRERAGIGCFGTKQLDTMEELAARFREQHPRGILLAAFHHHVLPVGLRTGVVGGLPRERVSLTDDAVDALSRLGKAGVRACFHGHQHVPAILPYEDLRHVDPKIWVVAAASVGSGEKDIVREFYYYTIGEDAIDVKVFQADKRDPDRFVPLERVIRLPLPETPASPSQMAPDLCRFEVGLSMEQITTPLKDESDLGYLLFTVTDCARAREVIRRVLGEINAGQHQAFAGGIRPSIQLQGQYDLAGRWDLLVRIRWSPQSVSIDAISKAIWTQLASEGLVVENPDDTLGASFGETRAVNVLREFDMRLSGTPGSELAWRVLQNTQKYEEQRAQRAFLHLELPRRGSKKGVLDAVRLVLEQNPAEASVVERVSVGGQDVMLGLFASCSRQMSINRLSRLLGPVLAHHKLQKATLFCYEYDEGALISLPTQESKA